MLSYELAKRLKEAGFPQHKHCECPNMDYCTFTLEELIEACGDRFHSLRQIGDTWMVDGYDTKQGVTRESYFGPNPSEAVANLWLALNKK